MNRAIGNLRDARATLADDIGMNVAETHPDPYYSSERFRRDLCRGHGLGVNAPGLATVLGAL